MNQPRFNDDLLELAWLACDGTASEEQLAELAARLQADPEALHRYVQFMAMHADMQWDYIEKGVLPTDLPSLEKMSPPLAVGASSSESAPNPLPGLSPSVSLDENALEGGATPLGIVPSMPQSWLGFSLPSLVFLTLFILIVGALGAEAWLSLRRPGPQIVREQPPVVAAAAYLTSTTGCAWGGRAPQLHSVGNSVDLGEEIALLEGIAEFRLSNGVYLSVEGPAGLVLAARDSLVLQHGKVTVHIPWSASDFQILAGACRLNATDAEFGVSVTGGRIDAHVFSGEVLVTNLLMSGCETDGDGGDVSSSVLASGDEFVKGVISQGRALSLVTQGGVIKVRRWEKSTPSLFATRLTMAGQLPVSEAYVAAVLASAPKGYWRFESVKDGVVSSEVPEACDLNASPELRISGRIGNRVAEFHPGFNACLISSQPLDILAKTDYTIEFWAKPSHVHTGDILALCALNSVSGREGNALLVELQGSARQSAQGSFSQRHPGSIRFLHRDPPASSYRLGTSCFSERPYGVRRWQHVVAVKRRAHMELYTDGTLVAQDEDKTSLSPGLRLVVGRQDSVDDILPFSGQLDELAIYTRALTQDEIQTHYRLIDWSLANPRIADPDDI